MHIPDGYLSPQTCAILGAASAVVLHRAAKNVRREYSGSDHSGREPAGRELPLLAIGAAFSFAVMMFNIPIPDGTTAHAVGGTLLAVVLGPWAASLTLTVTLVVQAVFFGDGGILALGANVFNMAVILPFSGYWLYRLLTRKLPPTAAAFVSAYVAITLAALGTAVALGLQPVLFRGADGVPLYSPYPLWQAVAAMLFAHLLVAGPAEGILAAGALSYLLARDDLAQLFPRLSGGRLGTAGGWSRRRTKRWWPLAAIVGALLLLSPLGLLPPGSAWGEWSAEEIGGQFGFIPAGMARLGSLWRGFFPDYALPSSIPAAVGYILAGAFGVAAIALLSAAVFALMRARRRGTAFLRKTLRHIAEALETTLGSEEIARRDGLLQKTPTVPKIIVLLAVIMAAALARSPWLLAGLYLLCLALAALSGVPPRIIAGRVWLGVTLFTGVAVLPSVLSWVAPGTPLLVIAPAGTVGFGPWRIPAELAVTREGLMGALFVLARVAVSLSAATLLAVTTRWGDLIRGLGRLGTPRFFVGLLEMTYRYLVLLVRTAGELFEARESRSVGRASGPETRRLVGGAAGSLLARSAELSEEVYLAMRSRGYGAASVGRPDDVNNANGESGGSGQSAGNGGSGGRSGMKEGRT